MNTYLRHWLLLITLGVLTGACAHETESPNPTGTAAMPDLVCNAKPADRDYSTVEVRGSGFTPMPSKVLESDTSAQLVLPKIELRQAKDLVGLDNTTAHVVLADDPAKPADSRVHWFSQERMSFDVRPEDNLPIGVFTLQVTNPDGKGATQIPMGLAILPPPVIGELQPPTICDDQSDQQVEIIGTNFLKLGDVLPTVTVGDKTYTPTQAGGCVPVVGNFSEPSVELCTSLTIVIKQGDFVVDETTTVKVVVTNPPPADCASSESIELTIQPPPTVDSVVPSTVCVGGSALTIHGKNFQQDAVVELLCGDNAPVTSSSTQVSDDGTSISASFGPTADVGEECQVIVRNPDGCDDRPLPHETVTVVDGPILFFVDPSVVFNGVNTRITLFVTTITTQTDPPLGDVRVWLTPAGAVEPETDLTINAVPNHPNRLQALVPEGTTPGVYDVHVVDASGCSTLLENGLVVTDETTVTIASVKPSFGWTERDTAVTIYRQTDPANTPFAPTPRAFLNPTTGQATDIAVEIASVSFVDENTATGIVPLGTAVGTYDLILVNPDGSVGLLPDAFTEVADAPPVIESATPASIAASTGEQVILSGTNFATGATVSLACVGGGQQKVPPVTSAEPTCDGTACTMLITIDGSALAAGDVCVVTLTNPDGAYGEFSAIGVTTPALNLNDPGAGTDMNVARRAVSAASGMATPAARFVYALGGDSGQASGALDSTEFASVDLFGTMGPWTLQGATLHAPRTLAGATTVGRYIYLVGGDDGSGPVATAERALILSPRETPVIEDVDLKLGDVGLAEGEWHYRVSAVFDAADLDNPGGESLPSDEFSLRLPNIQDKKIAVTLVWKAPVDGLGQALPNVVGYRIYRTPTAGAAGGEIVLLGTVDDPTTLTFTDDGSLTPTADKPLPLGSTGHWLTLPAMGTARAGVAVAAGFDPDDDDTFYVYALLGKTGGSAVTGGYEFLPVTIAPNGRQAFAGAWIAGAQSSGEPRWQAGAWLADAVVDPSIAAGETYVYLGGGLTGNDGAANRVDVGKISTGGDLGLIDDTPGDFSSNRAGYGVFAGNGQLFVFGGGPQPKSNATSAEITTAPALANNAWNNQGLQMTNARYLLGSSVQSAFIFLVGGQTDTESATRTTDLVIW